MSTVRTATYTEGTAGIFSLTCNDCPLKPHAEALGQRTPECTGGIATNMQGPVPLRSCQHLERDSFGNGESGEITIRCNWTPAEVPA